eukprot:COSAG02_NODE_304_length_25204_cov_11.025095_15_plen_79_part_00
MMTPLVGCSWSIGTACRDLSIEKWCYLAVQNAENFKIKAHRRLILHEWAAVCSEGAHGKYPYVVLSLNTLIMWLVPTF